MNVYHLKHILNQLSRRLHKLLRAKIWHYAPLTMFKSVCVALFDSHVRCGSQIWGQIHNSHIRGLEKIKNISVTILKFEKSSPFLSKFCHGLRNKKLCERYSYSEWLHVCHQPTKKNISWCLWKLLLWKERPA